MDCRQNVTVVQQAEQMFQAHGYRIFTTHFLETECGFRLARILYMREGCLSTSTLLLMVICKYVEESLIV
jgi:hypothetical protein